MTLGIPAQFVWILGGACGVMLLLWFVQRRIRDAGVVDVGWAGLLGLAAIFAALTGEGDATRRAIVGIAGGVWGLRLAWHLLTDRVLFATHEDGRYLELRERMGPRIQPFLLFFFQAQAVSVALLAAPFVLAAADAGPVPGWQDLGGIVICVIGVIGESIADRQLKRFKADPANRGRTCRAGLWAWSRHPNYFFEWLIWCGFAMLAARASFGWAAWLAPAVILFLILKVTGIPPTERRALRTRGDDYRDYKRTTSAFFPWFPKRGSA